MRRATFLFITLFFVSCASTRTPEKEVLVCPPSKNYIHYTIKKGDSLWRLARDYGASVEDLMRENKIASAKNLKIGQKIIIPMGFMGTSGFGWPLPGGEVVSYFGENIGDSSNKGINIKTVNQEYVKASADGKVVFRGYIKGWGETLMIQHTSNIYTIYANLDNVSIKEGAFTKKGEVVASVASGKNGNQIMHFEIRKNCIPQNPLRYLN